MASLTRLLADADIVVNGVLSADDFVTRLLRTYEPFPAPAGGTSAATDPWPMAMEEEWARVRVDGLLHATFWVAEWPRTDVRSDFLAPLLLGSARVTLSVVMEPLGPEKAVRKVEASRTADLADAESRFDHLKRSGSWTLDLRPPMWPGGAIQCQLRTQQLATTHIRLMCAIAVLSFATQYSLRCTSRKGINSDRPEGTRRQ